MLESRDGELRSANKGLHEVHNYRDKQPTLDLFTDMTKFVESVGTETQRDHPPASPLFAISLGRTAPGQLHKLVLSPTDHWKENIIRGGYQKETEKKRTWSKKNKKTKNNLPEILCLDLLLAQDIVNECTYDLLYTVCDHFKTWQSYHTCRNCRSFVSWSSNLLVVLRLLISSIWASITHRWVSSHSVMYASSASMTCIIRRSSPSKTARILLYLSEILSLKCAANF